jgi:peptidoglycan hydrolase-like protein with peptidoglycan-binding domain
VARKNMSQTSFPVFIILFLLAAAFFAMPQQACASLQIIYVITSDPPGAKVSRGENAGSMLEYASTPYYSITNQSKGWSNQLFQAAMNGYPDSRTFKSKSVLVDKKDKKILMHIHFDMKTGEATQTALKNEDVDNSSNAVPRTTSRRAIYALQQLLIKLGYKSINKPSGIMSQATANAISQFQKKHGYRVNGKPSLNLLAVVGKAASGKGGSEPFGGLPYYDQSEYREVGRDGTRFKNECGLYRYKAEKKRIYRNGVWIYYYRITNLNPVPVQVTFRPVTSQKVSFKVIRGGGSCNGKELFNYNRNKPSEVHYLKKLPSVINLDKHPNGVFEVKIEIHGPEPVYHPALFASPPKVLPLDGSCGKLKKADCAQQPCEPCKIRDDTDSHDEGDKKPDQTTPPGKIKPRKANPLIGYWTRYTKWLKTRFQKDDWPNEQDLFIFNEDGTFEQLGGIINTPSRYSKGPGTIFIKRGKYSVDSSTSTVSFNIIEGEMLMSSFKGHEKSMKSKVRLNERVVSKYSLSGGKLVLHNKYFAVAAKYSTGDDSYKRISKSSAMRVYTTRLVGGAETY